MSTEIVVAAPPPLVTKSKAIVELTLRNLALTTALNKLAEEKDALQAKIAELEQKLKCSFPQSFFSSIVERLFKKGDIPVPKEILQFKFPVDFICESTDVQAHPDGFFVRATFDSNGYGRQVTFKFVPIPMNEVVYPDFHMGYEKQKPTVKRKPRTRKKRSDSVPPEAP